MTSEMNVADVERWASALGGAALAAYGIKQIKEFGHGRRARGGRRHAHLSIPTMQAGDILGHEFMGEVVEIGREITTLSVGPLTISHPFAFTS